MVIPPGIRGHRKPSAGSGKRMVAARLLRILIIAGAHLPWADELSASLRAGPLTLASGRAALLGPKRGIVVHEITAPAMPPRVCLRWFGASRALPNCGSGCTLLL